MNWLRRGGLAAAAVVVAASFGANPAAAQEQDGPQQQPQRLDRTDVEALRDRLGPVPEVDLPAPEAGNGPAAAEAPEDGGMSTQSLPPGLCYGQNYGDANEAGDTLLDAVTYAFGFDCVSSSYVYNVQTADSFADADLAWLDLAIDTNGNMSDGCSGFDFIALLAHDGAGYFGGLIRTPACADSTWYDVPGAEMGYGRLAGNQIGFSFKRAPLATARTLRWNSTIAHSGAIDPVDAMPDVGVRSTTGNPCGARCFYLTNGTTGGAAEIVFRDTQPASQILIGDWDGDGGDSLGFRLSSTYALKNQLAPTAPDQSFAYGRPNDVVLVGDWDGDGTDTLAVRRGNTYYMKNSFAGGAADITVPYGRPNDVVLVGDWDGDGTDTLAVRRASTYFISNDFSGGAADAVVGYGRPGDIVLVGDWDANGTDTLAVRRASTYFLKNAIAGGAADTTFSYGTATDVTFVGDWNADGSDTLGVRR